MTDEALAATTAAIIIIVSVGIVTFAVLRAANYPHPTSMVTALALLTLLSLMGLGITDGEAANTFGTLAAAGMGALAGAVTSQFQTKPPPGKEPPDDDTE